MRPLRRDDPPLIVGHCRVNTRVISRSSRTNKRLYIFVSFASSSHAAQVGKGERPRMLARRLLYIGHTPSLPYALANRLQPSTKSPEARRSTTTSDLCTGHPMRNRPCLHWRVLQPVHPHRANRVPRWTTPSNSETHHPNVPTTQ